MDEEGLHHFVKNEVPLFAHQKAIAGTVAMKCFEKSKAPVSAAKIDAEILEYNGCSTAVQKAIGCVNFELFKGKFVDNLCSNQRS